MKKKNNIFKKIANKAYEFGFITNIKTDIIESGLNEDVRSEERRVGKECRGGW